MESRWWFSCPKIKEEITKEEQLYSVIIISEKYCQCLSFNFILKIMNLNQLLSRKLQKGMHLTRLLLIFIIILHYVLGSHPPHSTLEQYRSTFSRKLRPPRCSTGSQFSQLLSDSTTPLLSFWVIWSNESGQMCFIGRTRHCTRLETAQFFLHYKTEGSNTWKMVHKIGLSSQEGKGWHILSLLSTTATLAKNVCSCIRKGADSAVLRVCYATLWRCMRSSLKPCGQLASQGLRPP